jgi:hypothetical protein
LCARMLLLLPHVCVSVLQLHTGTTAGSGCQQHRTSGSRGRSAATGTGTGSRRRPATRTQACGTELLRGPGTAGRQQRAAGGEGLMAVTGQQGRGIAGEGLTRTTEAGGAGTLGAGTTHGEKASLAGAAAGT